MTESLGAMTRVVVVAAGFAAAVGVPAAQVPATAGGKTPVHAKQVRRLLIKSAMVSVTTAREVGGEFEKTKQWRAESAAHTIIAPRILLYPMPANLVKPGETFNQSPAEYRALVRQARARGADGIKLIGPMDRDQTAAVLDEAKKTGLPTTVHNAVGEATARDFVDLGVNCIEHFGNTD